MDNHQPPASQPPSGLADVLNPANEQRDSAYYSSGSGDASKREEHPVNLDDNA